MRAVAVTAERKLCVVDKPEPDPGPGEVVVAVERCGICGSDVHVVGAGILPAGAVPGHEIAGTVVAGDVTGSRLELGQRVAVLPSRRCGTCPACMAGRDNLCTFQLFSSIGLGVKDGGYAERVLVTASSCHPVPDAISPGHAALVEPYAVALHAVGRSRAPIGPDVAVGVIGSGSVGLMCVAALRRAGVVRIAVAEPRERRSAVAAALGAAVVDRGHGLASALGGPPDVVFEAAGGKATAATAVEVAAAGGQVVLLGVVGPGEDLALPGLLWVVKEVDVAPSIAYTTDEFAAAMAAVADGAVDDVLAACEVRPLAEADHSLDELRLVDGPVKVLLDPSR